MPRVSDDHRAARRRQILDAARTCFLRDGFHATSMSDVLAEAQLSAGAVYRYFPGKNAIVLAIVTETSEGLVRMWDATLESDELPPLADAVSTVVEGVQRLDDESGVPRLALQVWGEAVRSPEVREIVSGVGERLLEKATLVVRRYQDRGDIDAAVDAGSVARTLIALFPGFILQREVMGSADAAQFRTGLHALLPGPRPGRSSPG